MQPSPYSNSPTLWMMSKQNVLLIHGILMNPLEMRFLGWQLESSGFHVHYVYYQSVLKTPSENARIIHKKIQKLKLDQLHIVAHSLGGVITMHLFDQFDDVPDGRVVMLGSPVNGGSWIARKMHNWPIVSPLLTRSMSNALSGKGVPDWKTKRDWGMIAGTKSQAGLGMIVGGLPNISDGTVLVEETQHKEQTAHTIVNISHTGLLFSKRVAKLTSNFLRKGHFN